MNRRRQAGLATVEFAVVGMLTMIMIFALLEVSRAMFVFNALDEVTRRGARMAAVCPVNSPAIKQAALSGPTGDGLLPGLRPENVTLEYLNLSGQRLSDPAASYGQIRFVRVRIDDFQHRLIIPLFVTAFNTPGFETTLPRESLGVSRQGLQSC
jgi:hypothetical protein